MVLQEGYERRLTAYSAWWTWQVDAGKTFAHSLKRAGEKSLSWATPEQMLQRLFLAD
jgi:hypothetical protein